MPILEADMPYEQMEKIANDGHTCGQCGGRLSVAWSAKDNCYILRCGNDINHNTITRHDKKREQQIQQIKEARHLDSKSLMVMDESKMLARVEMAKFPQELTVIDKKLLAEVARTYGFDPLMNEVSIYQGRPYVSIDGRYRMAQETGNLDGVDTRPATKQEREDWGIPDGDYFFRAEVYVKGTNRPFVGWGRVYLAETQGGRGFKPVEKNPQRMAEKRAEAQALRKAFHIPLPSFEDIGAPDGNGNVPRVVDVTTGEIVESESVEVKEIVKAEQESPAIDPTWLKESLKAINWSERTAISWLVTNCKVPTAASLSTALTGISKENTDRFVKEIEERLKMV